MFWARRDYQGDTSHQKGFAVGALIVAIALVIFATGIVAQFLSPTFTSLVNANDAASGKRNLYVASQMILGEIDNAHVANRIPHAPPATNLPQSAFDRLPPAADTANSGSVSLYGGLVPGNLSSAHVSGVRYCAYANTPANAIAAQLPGVDSTAAANYTLPADDSGYRNTLSHALDRPMFAFISPGQDGIQQTTCLQAANGEIQGDDRAYVHVVGEARNDVIKRLLQQEEDLYAHFFSGQTECPAGQKLGLEEIPGSIGTPYRLVCRDETNPTALAHALQALPATCTNGTFLIVDPLNSDGFYCAYLDTTVTNAGEVEYAAQQNFNLAVTVTYNPDPSGNPTLPAVQLTSATPDNTDSLRILDSGQTALSVKRVYYNSAASSHGMNTSGRNAHNSFSGLSNMRYGLHTDAFFAPVVAHIPGFTPLSQNNQQSSGRPMPCEPGADPSNQNCLSLYNQRTAFMDVNYTCSSTSLYNTSVQLIFQFTNNQLGSIELCDVRRVTRASLPGGFNFPETISQNNSARIFPTSETPSFISLALANDILNVWLIQNIRLHQPANVAMDGILGRVQGMLASAAYNPATDGIPSAPGVNPPTDDKRDGALDGGLGGQQTNNPCNSGDPASGGGGGLGGLGGGGSSLGGGDPADDGCLTTSTPVFAQSHLNFKAIAASVVVRK